MNGNKKIKAAGICACAALAAVLVAVPHSAEAAKKKKTWVLKNQSWYYYGKKGKKAKGLTKIGKRYYYFDSKGVQRTGWQKIGKKYYYFRIGHKKKGYMQSGKTINGISLRKNGTAKMTSYAKKKMKVLIYANRLVESETKPTMSRKQKLRIVYDYLIKNYSLWARTGKFEKTANWDIDYAKEAFNNHRGACYAWGSAMAYLGNAVGYSCSAVSSGGHGWAEINGYVSDPYWEKAAGDHSYFIMNYSLSGKEGRPNYKRARTYVKKI